MSTFCSSPLQRDEALRRLDSAHLCGKYLRQIHGPELERMVQTTLKLGSPVDTLSKDIHRQDCDQDATCASLVVDRLLSRQSWPLPVGDPCVVLSSTDDAVPRLPSCGLRLKRYGRNGRRTAQAALDRDRNGIDEHDEDRAAVLSATPVLDFAQIRAGLRIQ
jgi:hypothetical protein